MVEISGSDVTSWTLADTADAIAARKESPAGRWRMPAFLPCRIGSQG